MYNVFVKVKYVRENFKMVGCLEGKVVLVIGVVSGIGEGIVKWFVEEGVFIVVVDL